jgi:hypothetical protein
MTRTHAFNAVAIGTASALLAIAPPTSTARAQSARPRETAAAVEQTVSDFQKRCDDYVALHKKIESGLPRVPDDASPEQIDLGQQALSKGIRAARASARVGDVFSPAIQAHVRRVLGAIFASGDGKQLRDSILDENPVGAAVRINGDYPDEIPLSTMPPQVLDALPRLPKELEYRFVGERLILFDHHAHLIVDYIAQALPRV